MTRILTFMIASLYLIVSIVVLIAAADTAESTGELLEYSQATALISIAATLIYTKLVRRTE